MQKLSGLVLDVYDDQGGSILKEVYATAADLPESVKTAHLITQAEYARLPDVSFALVLEDGPVELKKFATIDEGNTVLSVVYFLKTAHKLPVEAQQVAASNLLQACSTYGFEPPEQLSKLALCGADVKANLDSAPNRQDKFPLKSAEERSDEHSTPEEKLAGLLGAALTATAVPGAVREAKQNLQATQGAGGAIMTPGEIQTRKFQMGMVGRGQ